MNPGVPKVFIWLPLKSWSYCWEAYNPNISSFIINYFQSKN